MVKFFSVRLEQQSNVFFITSWWMILFLLLSPWPHSDHIVIYATFLFLFKKAFSTTERNLIQTFLSKMPLLFVKFKIKSQPYGLPTPTILHHFWKKENAGPRCCSVVFALFHLRESPTINVIWKLEKIFVWPAVVEKWFVFQQIVEDTVPKKSFHLRPVPHHR